MEQINLILENFYNIYYNNLSKEIRDSIGKFKMVYQKQEDDVDVIVYYFEKFNTYLKLKIKEDSYGGNEHIFYLKFVSPSEKLQTVYE